MNNTIKKCLSENTTDINSSLDRVINELKRNLLSEKDEMLLNLSFSNFPKQEELDKFLVNWDIEANGAHKALMLSYFMKMHPELSFPQYVGPRLNGLLKYYKFQNMNLIAHFFKISNELRKHNIPFILMKGGAMKCYRPELSRVMGDTDILVPEKDWYRAGKIAEDMEYYASWGEHSIDIHIRESEYGLADIHRYICMNTGCERNINDDLFKRAEERDFMNIKTLVPSKEDMVFISMVNMVRNLSENTSVAGILYTLFDCHWLIKSKPDFDWKIIEQNAVKTKTKEQICLAIKFINNIVPDLLPDNLDFLSGFTKELENYYKLFIYQRIYLYPMKMRGHELTLSKALKDKELFKEYIRLKPKYLILKQKFVKTNPILTGLILKAHKSHTEGSRK